MFIVNDVVVPHREAQRRSFCVEEVKRGRRGSLRRIQSSYPGQGRTRSRVKAGGFDQEMKEEGIIMLTVMILSVRTNGDAKSVFLEDLLLDCEKSCLNSTGDASILSLTCRPTASLPQSVPHSTSWSYALPRLRRHPSLFLQATAAEVTDYPQRRGDPLYRIPEPLLLRSLRLVSRHKTYNRHAGFRTIDASRNGHELHEGRQTNVQVPRSNLVFAGVEASSGVDDRMDALRMKKGM
ncbi:hypothetical protein GALMADRAFT_1209223 [Galerina marginata CBS 339.88]|uniref:Uncharacterized protein n=1 Tax=Galerina marginata (strain CBS 339.88) TaxID=685588 RepID=A0A067S855_GALM3|nr:hypothetical protein GALMADRAFT_1209223 [Galerina marginata CBS 339.88]